MKKIDIINIFEPLSEGFHYYRYSVRKKVFLNDEIVPFDKIPELSKYKKDFNELTWVFLPRAVFIEKHLSIPSHDDVEIEQMANIQVIKLVPFSPDEIITYNQIVDKVIEGYSFTLLFIIIKEKLAALIKPIIGAGFVPDELFITPMLVPVVIENLTYESAAINRFVQLFDDHIELGIYRNDKLVYSRPIDVVIENIKDFQRAVLEIKQSFEFAAKKVNVVLSEACFLIGNLPNEELEKFQSKTEEFLPFPFGIKETAQFHANTEHRKPFTLDQVRTEKATRNLKLHSIRFAVLFLLIMISIFGYLQVRNQTLSRRMAILDKEIYKIKDAAESAKVFKDKIEISTRHLNSTNSYIASILELYTLIPENITLTLLHFKDFDTLALKGIAKNGIINVVELLEKSPRFKNVSLRYQNKLNKESGVEFHITCKIE